MNNISLHVFGVTYQFLLFYSGQGLPSPFRLFISPAVFLCNVVAQTQLVKATAAIESAVFVTTQWLASVKPSSGLLYTIAEELKSQVKKLGGYFQLLIQVNTETAAVTLFFAFHVHVQDINELKSAKSELRNDFQFSVVWAGGS